MRAGVLVGLTTAIAALATAPAQALTVSVDTGEPDSAVATVQAAPGEANRLAASFNADGFTVEDLGVPVTAEAPCEAIDEHHARCLAGEAHIDLGDGDDQATLACAVTCRGLFVVNAGEGDDTVVGSPGGDELRGERGADRLSAGAGDDTFIEDDDPTGADTLDGGPGIDRVRFRGVKVPLRIDLAKGTAAGATITATEDVEGGLAADVITGNAGPNKLLGSELGRSVTGGDVIRGGGGHDELYGALGHADRLDGGDGPDLIDGYGGADRMDGGAGRDVISLSGTRGSQRVDCGAGDDLVEPAYRHPERPVISGCERFQFSFGYYARLIVAPRHVTVAALPLTDPPEENCRYGFRLSGGAPGFLKIPSQPLQKVTLDRPRTAGVLTLEYSERCSNTLWKPLFRFALT